MDPKYDQLIEPPRIAFSFGAPGWYVLGALLLLLGLIIAGLLIRQYKRNRYRRKALALLPPDADVYTTNMLLKRVAITIHPRETTTGLRDAEWIDFLNTTRRSSRLNTTRRNPNPLFDETDRLLLTNLYRQQTIASPPFRAKAREWIKKHHRAI